MPATPPTDPDSLAILHAFSGEDLSREDAYNALGGVRNLAGQTIAAAIEAQNAKLSALIEAQNAKLSALIEAQNAKFSAAVEALRAEISAIRWTIGIGLGLLALLVTLLRFLN